MSARESFAQKVASDPRLRLHTPEAEDDTPAPLDPRTYQAFRTSSRRPPRLRIRCKDGPGHSLPYMALLDIIADDRFGASFALVFHHMTVQVTGRNLGPVVDAIGEHRAVGVLEFDPQAYDVPGEERTLITKIEVDNKQQDVL